MRVKIFMMIGALCIASLSALSQSSVDKVNDALYKADKVKGTVDKVKGWLPKKKKKDAAADSSKVDSANVAKAATGGVNVNITMVNVSGIDFSNLKKFQENIRACAGVDTTFMKYNLAASTIEVRHKGSTEDLLQLMQETSKDIFTEKNIEGFETGKIFIKL